MKIRTIAFASVAVAALGVGPANASPTGWYLGLGVGYDHLSPVHMTSSFPFAIDLEHSESSIVVGSVGYRFDSGLRIENEIGWSSHDVSKGTGLDGSTDLKSELVNFVYDFPVSDQWTLSLGGGVGGAEVGSHLRQVSPPNLFFVHGSHIEFQWQGIAGISYSVQDDLELFADYRYRSADVNQNYFSEIVAYNPIRIHQVQEQVGLIGIRWFLSPPPPPPPPPVPLPPPAPPPPPPPIKVFTVFFDYDKSNLTAQAQEIVAEAVKTAITNGFVNVLVTGNTDTVGSDSYNQGLSERRAESVKDEMVRKGMNGGDIKIEGKSFHDLLVPTGPGVREPQNRRAVINFSINDNMPIVK